MPKVLDFGISKTEDPRLAASLTEPGAFLGTTLYSSPEQVAGERVDAATDQYSLGVVLYECLTGQRPYGSRARQELVVMIREGKIVPPSRLKPELSAELEAVVLRALAVDRAARFPGAHALGAALLPFASPKSRLAWADYYERPPAPAPAGDAGPRVRSFLVAAGPAPAAPHAAGPAEGPADCPPTVVHEPAQASETRTAESPAVRRRTLPWIAGALGLAGAAAVIALLVDDHSPAARRPTAADLPTVAPVSAGATASPPDPTRAEAPPQPKLEIPMAEERAAETTAAAPNRGTPAPTGRANADRIGLRATGAPQPAAVTAPASRRAQPRPQGSRPYMLDL